MANAQAVSPSPEGTCILKPSPRNGALADIQENVKTDHLRSSLKNESDTMTSGENSRQQVGRQMNRIRKRKRRNSMSDNATSGTLNHQNVKRKKGSGHHKRNPSTSRIILPTNFLHGGNIADPLNLNSMMDETVNRALNAVTPTSSPLPPRNSVIDIITPLDITDPLGLNSLEPTRASNMTKLKSGRTKRKKYQMLGTQQDHHSAAEATKNSDEPAEALTDSLNNPTDNAESTPRKINRSKRSKQSPNHLALSLSTTQTHVHDPIVSPAIPQDVRRTKSHMTAKHRRRKHGGRPATNDTVVPTDSVDKVKSRCGSEKTPHGSYFSPVKRRRTNSENFCSLHDGEGSRHFFSGFFHEGTAPEGLQNLLVNRTGTCTNQEESSQSPTQSYMNSEKMSPQKSVSVNDGQETRCLLKSKLGKQVGLVLPTIKNETGTHSSPNTVRRKRPYNAPFQYGNYIQYYGYRNEEKFKDSRLGSLKKEWFKDKDVLDIGCNAGHLTLLIARDYQPRKIVGIDIDERLIRIARNNIRHYASNPKSGKSGSKFPASMVITMGPLATPPVETGKDDTTAAFPNNVNFFQGNYVPKKDEILRFQEPEYDVIMCMSVTKWVHMNWGDDGLMRLFQRAFKQLRAGGMFILEPQPWASYASKRKMCEQLNEIYQTLQMRPELFPTTLTRDIGFARVEHVRMIEKTASRGFKRPIQVYYKPE